MSSVGLFIFFLMAERQAYFVDFFKGKESSKLLCSFPEECLQRKININENKWLSVQGLMCKGYYFLYYLYELWLPSLQRLHYKNFHINSNPSEVVLCEMCPI